MSESRAYTAEEVREQFLSHLRNLARYWADLPNKTPLERTEGMLFSVLTTIDGGTLAVPAMDLIPLPHPEDKEYFISEGENYYEPVVINDCQLHELVYKDR